MPFYFANERNLAYRMCVCGHCMFSKLAAALEANPWDTSNQPQCMCDTCFFIQSSCLFIFHHHQNASCYFLPNSGQTNNRCERFGTHCTLPTTSPPSLPPVLRLVCDNLCTLALSSHPLSRSFVSLEPAHPSSAMWGHTAAPISHPLPLEHSAD